MRATTFILGVTIGNGAEKSCRQRCKRFQFFRFGSVFSVSVPNFKNHVKQLLKHMRIVFYIDTSNIWKILFRFGSKRFGSWKPNPKKPKKTCFSVFSVLNLFHQFWTFLIVSKLFSTFFNGFEQFPNGSERFQTIPNGSETVPNGSKQFRNGSERLRNGSERFWTFPNGFERFSNVFERFRIVYSK